MGTLEKLTPAIVFWHDAYFKGDDFSKSDLKDLDAHYKVFSCGFIVEQEDCIMLYQSSDEADEVSETLVVPKIYVKKIIKLGSFDPNKVEME
jgi:hypothetical protein